MKRIALVAGLVACTQLSGCWFVFIPGSLIQKVSDGLTGAEGEHCVTRAAKVGDVITLSGSGQRMTVQSLSGTSVKCAQPEFPIRAALVPA